MFYYMRFAINKTPILPPPFFTFNTFRYKDNSFLGCECYVSLSDKYKKDMKMKNLYLLIFRTSLFVLLLLIFLSVNVFASILIESGSYGEISPAENGDMHILIRNDNSSYIYYSSGRVVKNVPIGMGDSTIIFETATSDGVDGVYVLYNNTANKTLFAQRYNSNGEALWEEPGSIVSTYNNPRVFSASVLGPDSRFVVVYDDFFPIYVTPAAYLWIISPDGDVSSHESGRFTHDWHFEMHSDPYEVYIKQAQNSYIAPIYNFIPSPSDTSKLGILEFDCDDNGFLFAIRKPLESNLKRELQRYDNQLNALWEMPIVFYAEMLGKTSSDIEYDCPEIIANNDGSVTLYPSSGSQDWNFSRIDSSGEFIYNVLELIGDSYRIKAALSCSDGSNLFLVFEGETDIMRLIKVSVEGNIEFSTVLKSGSCRYASIIENTDSTYATIMITSTDSIFVDKISNTGEILVGIEEADHPMQFTLHQNYPNPFNPNTTIQYEVPEASDIKISVYDITGHLKGVLVDEYHQAGAYNVKWNASKYSSGIYIYRLDYNGHHVSKKMLLIK